jgi:hypothetical protein
MEPAFADLAAYYLPLSYSQQVYLYLEKKTAMAIVCSVRAALQLFWKQTSETEDIHGSFGMRSRGDEVLNGFAKCYIGASAIS